LSAQGRAQANKVMLDLYRHLGVVSCKAVLRLVLDWLHPAANQQSLKVTASRLKLIHMITETKHSGAEGCSVGTHIDSAGSRGILSTAMFRPATLQLTNVHLSDLAGETRGPWSTPRRETWMSVRGYALTLCRHQPL
jgi:hypothetical protein